MRKVIVLEHISLDGVIQAGGGPNEDTSDGFKYGGWAAPYDDDAIGAALRKMMNSPFDLLVGRKTFDIWEAYWPNTRIFGPALTRLPNTWRRIPELPANGSRQSF